LYQDFVRGEARERGGEEQMLTINGKHNAAIVFTDNIENTAHEQLEAVCNAPYLADCKVRVMPDVHAGKGCTIGTTMTIHGKVVPNMVGVDIGCGMYTVKLEDKSIDFNELDATIRKHIPSGRAVRSDVHQFAEQVDLNKLQMASMCDIDRAYRSIGSLGGGNHFIEVDKDNDGHLYLVIHSGSRHLGVQVADYYQDAAYWQLSGKKKQNINAVIAELKAQGRHKEISETVKKLKVDLTESEIPRDMAYVSGLLFDDYIHDMRITQHFAMLNRKAMADEIIRNMRLTVADEFTTIHNYIDTDAMILRKGAVSAKAGERLLIPINMRDGSLLCVGKGNPDWNQSAPHGAGRLMSRKKAKEKLDLGDYRDAMSGIFSTCINNGTLDEAPMAYKSMDAILKHIAPTVNVVKVIKPVFNFKAEE
jgi:hypothetical protein